MLQVYSSPDLTLTNLQRLSDPDQKPLNNPD